MSDDKADLEFFAECAEREGMTLDDWIQLINEIPQD